MSGKRVWRGKKTLRGVWGKDPSRKTVRKKGKSSCKGGSGKGRAEKGREKLNTLKKKKKTLPLGRGRALPGPRGRKHGH